MTKFLRVTEVLAMAGATDYSWVTEEAKYRGSEVHHAVKLASEGTLNRKSVPQQIEGYLKAFEKFKKECGFVPTLSEHEVKSTSLLLRGRLDAIGVLRGTAAIVDFKTGAMRAACGLQLCLYGHMYDPLRWWNRYGVQLREDGTYRLTNWPEMSWPADLSTALCCVRLAQNPQSEDPVVNHARGRVQEWRIANGLVTM